MVKVISMHTSKTSTCYKVLENTMGKDTFDIVVFNILMIREF